MRGVVTASIIILMVALVSCNLNLCEESTDVNFILGFYTVDEEIERDSVVYDLTIYGVGREDSLLYDHGAARKITLPLDMTSDTSRFVINIGGIQDVCTITCTRFVRLLSHDCGFITEFEILDFNHTTVNIDSVAIIQPKVTNFEEEHVKIFL